MKERFKKLIERYGKVFVAVYVLLTLMAYAGFFEAIGFTFDVDSSSEGMGALFGAWLLSKATQPLRVLLAALITRGIAPTVWRLFPGLAPADVG